jgi:hypothetical protein
LILHVRPDPKRFTFDYIGNETTSQQELFEVIGKPISVSCLDGYNSTIFAYGQTGAEKPSQFKGLLTLQKTLTLPKLSSEVSSLVAMSSYSSTLRRPVRPEWSSQSAVRT